MTVARRTAAVVAAAGFAAAAGLMPALPALAHGAPVQPLSRTASCAAGGEHTSSAVCRAARKANGRPFGEFDNLRVSGVNGRDVQVIPDGRLCSGNLPAFRGLDLPRTDWPATRLAAGSRLTERYRTTIPHAGKFRVYLTKQGYNPAKPLRWRDLSSKPIFTANNPPVRDGAYRFSGTLPADRSGRHLLLTVWQTTPDTYYSCSDLVLTPARDKAAVAVKPSPKPSPSAKAKSRAKPAVSRSAEPGAVVVDGRSSGPAVAAPPAQARGSWLSPASENRVDLGNQIIIATLVVLAGVLFWAGFRRLRSARATQRMHR